MSRAEQYILIGGEQNFRADSFVGFTKDLVQLTKPRILVLLLISTCCPMILAAHGQFLYVPLFWALLGGFLISASASVMNCILDRDIDAIMERTKRRPLPQGRVSVFAAGFFAFFLGLVGFLFLALQLNPTAGLVALFGHFFYVVIYTLWLKRRSVQNIVIGGAAGAIPPLVGWVGITGQVELDALLMFLLIFLWTPPHFWALALVKNDDYRRAGVPMMPVIKGERVTHSQMFWYALSLLPVSLWLVQSNSDLGLFSGVIFSALGTLFVFKVYRLMNAPADKKTERAWDVFGFSLIYLALFFVCLVVDSSLF